MKFAVSALAAAALTFATAAQAAETITKFDVATIDKVLAAVGAENIEKTNREGRTVVLFTVNGLKYVAGQQVCKEQGCLGFLMQCSFNTDSDSFSTATINGFNLTHVFTNVAVTDDRKSVFIGRYLIADGGTTVQNAIENMKVFLNMPAALVDHINKAGSTPVASVTPQATPAAASTPAAGATAAAAPAASVATQAASATPPGDWFDVAGSQNKIKP